MKITVSKFKYNVNPFAILHIYWQTIFNFTNKYRSHISLGVATFKENSMHREIVPTYTLKVFSHFNTVIEPVCDTIVRSVTSHT